MVVARSVLTLMAPTIAAVTLVIVLTPTDYFAMVGNYYLDIKVTTHEYHYKYLQKKTSWVGVPCNVMCLLCALSVVHDTKSKLIAMYTLN